MTRTGRALYNLDRELRFLSANEQALSMWGKQQDEVIGRRIDDVFPEVRGSEPLEAHARALKSLKPFRKVVRSPVLNQRIALEIHPSANGLSVSFVRLEPES